MVVGGGGLGNGGQGGGGHGVGNQGNQGASGQGGATLLLVAKATWKFLLSLERWTVQIWTLLLC